MDGRNGENEKEQNERKKGRQKGMYKLSKGQSKKEKGVREEERI